MQSRGFDCRLPERSVRVLVGKLSNLIDNALGRIEDIGMARVVISNVDDSFQRSHT